jgi:hypothetical protein
MVGRQRLRIGDIQDRREIGAADGVDEGILIDESRPPGVDEGRSRRQRGEFGRADHPGIEGEGRYRAGGALGHVALSAGWPALSRTTIGVVVGCWEPPAGSTVTPT